MAQLKDLLIIGDAKFLGDVLLNHDPTADLEAATKHYVDIQTGSIPTGTVTSVAASGSGGISISGSPITTSGTITVGLNLSTAINGLSEGASNATRDDYIVAQYAGGGTSTVTYHRRKLSNIFSALNSSDITTALGYTPVSGTGLSSGYFVVGNGTTTIKISSMQPTTSSTSWNSNSDGYIPTMKAISLYVTGLGYKTTDTNYYHTTGSWNGLTYTATANGGAGALAFTIPTGTSSTTVALGNHTHTASLSASGSSGTTLAHNTWYTLTAGGSTVTFKTPSDSNTDTKVTQTAVTGASATTYYPMLLAYSANQTATTTNTANFTSNIKATPSGDIHMTDAYVSNVRYSTNAHITYTSDIDAIEFVFGS